MLKYLKVSAAGRLCTRFRVSAEVDRIVEMEIMMPIPILRIAEAPALEDWMKNADRT